MIRFNTQKVEELIQMNGLKKGYIVNKLGTSWKTYRRWMKEETHIPFVKAVELADILDCNLDDLYVRVNNQ